MTGNQQNRRPAPNAARSAEPPPSPVDAKIRDVAAYLAKREKQIAIALPRGGLTKDRVIRIVLTEIRRNPDLLNCTPVSLLGAILTCSAVGLEIGAHLGHAYLVPYKSKHEGGRKVCTPIFGYRGLIALARRSGDVATVEAHVVRRGDAFSYRYGVDQHLEHVPSGDCEITKDKQGNEIVNFPEITHGWSLARFRDSSQPLFEVMSAAEIDAIARRNGGQTWFTDWAEMARKTVVRRIAKYLPLTTEAASAFAASEDLEERNRRPGYIADLDFVAEDEEREAARGDAPGNAIDAPAIEAQNAGAETIHETLGREEAVDVSTGEATPAELARMEEELARARSRK